MEKTHPERPARLIEAKIKQLQRDLHEPVSQLSGKEGAQLLNLISKLQGYSPHLSSAILHRCKRIAQANSPLSRQLPSYTS
jgi:hypothetical protein